MKPNSLSKAYASGNPHGDDDEGDDELVTDSIVHALDLYAKGDKKKAADELKGAIEACMSDYSE